MILNNYNQKLKHYQSKTNVYKFSFFPCTVPEYEPSRFQNPLILKVYNIAV